MAVVGAEMSIGGNGGAGIGCQQWWRKYLVLAMVVRVVGRFKGNMGGGGSNGVPVVGGCTGGAIGGYQ